MHEALITRDHVRNISFANSHEIIAARLEKVIYSNEKQYEKDVNEARDLTWLVNHPANCVLRHHNTKWCYHTAGVGGDETFELCAIHLVKAEGYETVRNYLVEMSKLFPITAGSQLLRFDAMQWII